MPPLTPRQRTAVLDRDERRCCRCHEPASEVDHILPRRFLGGNEEFNLQSLCKKCHSGKTYWDAGDIQARYHNTDARLQRASDYELHRDGECEWPCQFCEGTYEDDMRREAEEERWNPLDHDNDESWHYLPVVLAYATWAPVAPEWQGRFASWLWHAYEPATGEIAREVVGHLVRWARGEQSFPRPGAGNLGSAEAMLGPWVDAQTGEVFQEHIDKLREARNWYVPEPSPRPQQGKFAL